MQSKTKDQMSSYTNNGRIIHVEVQCVNIRPPRVDVRAIQRVAVFHGGDCLKND